jgi:RNA polymerase sigma factor (sigma-70 family)
VEPTRTRLGQLRVANTLEFEEFFRDHYDNLFRTAWLIAGSRWEGEELAQEAMARILERWEKVREGSNPVGYAYTTMVNLNRRRLRRLAIRRTLALRNHSGEDPIGMTETRVDVLRALASLPRKQREAVVLIEWGGMSPEEAGRVLGIKPVSVRGSLHRARETLRSQLGDVDGPTS